MKNILLSAALLSLILIAVPRLEAAKGGAHHPDFLKQLGLSDTQMQQVEAIKKSDADKKVKKQEIMAVLTPAQQTQFKALKKEWKTSHESSATTPTTSGPTGPTPGPTVNGQVTPLPGVPVKQ